MTDKQIYEYIKSKGLPDVAVASIVGNLWHESGLKSNNLQNTFNAKFHLTDAQYTEMVDSGEYKDFVTDSAGYGFAQWTYHTRKKKLLERARSLSVSIADEIMQLDFMWDEMQGYPEMLRIMRSATSVTEASNAFLIHYERPANMEAKKNERACTSIGFYNHYASNTGSGLVVPVITEAPFKPYMVRVNILNLNIRTKPSNKSMSKGYIPVGAYTIVEEADGPGATKWGKLKSGRGWISLDYATKIS